jgi:MtrB/PioB family decaheme-associated outer membrane protein
MKLPKLVIIIAAFGLTLSLTPFSPVYTADETFEATVGATGVYSNVNGSQAKYHEYTDSSTSHLYGKTEARYDSPSYFLNFKALNPGYDTQSYRMEGGSYGQFKLWFNYNEIIHNITDDARTFFSGAGSSILAGSAGTSSNTWTGIFDYSTKRKQFGAGGALSIAKPFFFNVDYLNEKKEGIRPTGSESTVALELPAVVNYTTNGLTLEGGYAKGPYFLSVAYIYSDFTNHDQDLFFTSPTGGIPSRGSFFSLPADSTMHKVAAKGSALLPMNSKLNLSFGTAETKSNTDSFSNFSGKVDTTNFDAGITTKPLRYLEGKAYYKYYDRDNKSTGILATGIEAGTPANRLSYQTNTYGAELGTWLPAKLFLNGGYKHVVTDRRFNDEIDPVRPPAEVLPDNTDNIYFAELKWSGIDIATFRLGYEFLGRSADFRTVESQALPQRSFSYAAQNRTTYKAAVDLSPFDALNLSLEYDYMRAHYNDTLFGATGSKTQAFSFNGDYLLKNMVRFSGYFDASKATFDQLEATTGATASQWSSTLEQLTYGYGVKAEVYAIPNKLTLSFSGDYLRNNGSDDLTFLGDINNYLAVFQLPAGGYNLPVSSPNVDSYQKYTLKFIASYNCSEALTIKAGYVYDRYIYSDAQLNDYRLMLNNLATSSNAYLTGAYANPPYSVNTVFLGFTYRFK